MSSSFPLLLEAVPLLEPVSAQVVVPGSKSITNRALILAALADGEVILEHALWSEDTQVMVNCLRQLGFQLEVAPDPTEPCNRTLTVVGQGGTVPPGGIRESPMELFVGNAGTAARFLAALVCLGAGYYRLSGVARMHERPQQSLFHALTQLGYRVNGAAHGRLPVTVEGGGGRPGQCAVSLVESSQFASALLLAGHRCGWQVTITGENPDESPYVQMTEQLLQSFPWRGGVFAIEPDASSGSYLWAANYLQKVVLGCERDEIDVVQWPTSGWQVDARFPQFLPLPETVSRRDDLGDSIMTAIVLAPFSDHPVEFRNLGRLRLQECERVEALRTELVRCGARVEEQGDVLRVMPSPLHGATIETYQDHRMAMCFAILGLHVPGIKIKNPGCVRKTFPNFFQKLAEPAPKGLGVRFLQGQNGLPVAWENLSAEEGKV